MIYQSTSAEEREKAGIEKMIGADGIEENVKLIKAIFRLNQRFGVYHTDEAKKKCHLGEEEIRMAKEMGLNPKSLIKNIPNKKEMWKAPVKDWIHDMYEKRQKKAEHKAKRKNKGNN